ncbi:hypothetical protein FRAHR75_730026 [Frankia sp. Hr75.2]|nr:hypothetical protein FRAHR75_730026 [Frankia sp. Hr75.2]
MVTAARGGLVFRGTPPSGTVRIWHGFRPGEATVTLDKTGSASATMTDAYPMGDPPYIPYSLPDADPADGSAADQAAADGA